MVGPAAPSDSSGVSSTYHSDISSSEGTALSKLRQTLSSGLMTAQDRGEFVFTFRISQSTSEPEGKSCCSIKRLSIIEP